MHADHINNSPSLTNNANVSSAMPTIMLVYVLAYAKMVKNMTRSQISVFVLMEKEESMANVSFVQIIRI